MWYMAQKVKKFALNSQIQALQILTNDDEVENWRLSSFLLAVKVFVKLEHLVELLLAEDATLLDAAISA